MSEEKKRYYRKNVELFLLLDKIKLWPSRNGILHGIRSVERNGEYAEITTHCGKTFRVYNSRNSRAGKVAAQQMGQQAVARTAGFPEWKLEKYSTTFFAQHYGSDLRHKD